jgi:hypothetical protein
VRKRKHKSIRLSNVLYEIEERNKKRALENARKGGFCCPGCGSGSLNEHTYTCRAAVVAGAYGVSLSELANMLRLWNEMRDALTDLLSPDSFDDVDSVYLIPKGTKFVKMTVTADEARAAGRILGLMGAKR